MRRWLMWWGGAAVVLLALWGVVALVVGDGRVRPATVASVHAMGERTVSGESRVEVHARIQVSGERGRVVPVPGSDVVVASPPAPLPSPTTSTPPGPSIRLTMPVEHWNLIDGTMDNTASTAAEDRDASTAAVADGVRAAGEVQVATGAPANGGWPAPGQDVTLELTAGQWRFVVAQIERWDAVAEPEPGDDHAALLTQIRAALPEQE